ncbi:aldose epimerase family protein [Streptacidiphilus carbonis]|uniref:aldose epimerase family protein n=1 Tax=Streptacidiphilus carbonis TaxID=105422 RepID=UPI001F466E7C|nr:aldose epimerase family protein [Streptacidiphilus carbonis]
MLSSAQSPSHAPVRESFGALADGTPVHRWILTDGRGTTATVLEYGAVLHTLHLPDPNGRAGEAVNVVLGHPDLDGYLSERPPFFGAAIGRFGNRIADGRFVLDGRTHRVPLSDVPRPNALHGGDQGFDARLWSAEPVEVPGGSGVELTLVSPDGDQGFPGTLRATVRYSLADGALRIDYRATTDAPTVVNLTNHSYLNLAGEGTGTVLDHELTLVAAAYLPVDRDLRPLPGSPAPVAGTPFDFVTARALGERIHDEDGQLAIAGGYDHCWALDGGRTDAPRVVAVLRHPGSGRVLTLSSTEPGIQVYSGNALDPGLTGPSGRPYGPYAGVALETQHFPDSPNRPDYPSTVLRPGEEYRSTTVYDFGGTGD